MKELTAEKRNKLLKKIYTEIVRGYSVLEWNNSSVFIKHLNHFDAFDTEEYYEKKYQYALNNNVPTEKERLDSLAEQGAWGETQEKEIRNLQDYFTGLQANRRKLIVPSDKEQNKIETENTEKRLNELQYTKLRLIGKTCESYAIKKQNEFYLMHTLYKDETFSKLYYEFKDFDELDSDELNELFFYSNNVLNEFNELNLRYVAIAPFFQNVFCLAESTYEFYGKPISTLTYYQSNLALYGSNFKYILGQVENVPLHIKEDPDALENFYYDTQNIKKIEDKAGGATNIIGLSEEERKALGSNKHGENVLDLNALSRDKKNLSKSDILNAMASKVSPNV